jgi:hypothetical protein
MMKPVSGLMMLPSRWVMNRNALVRRAVSEWLSRHGKPQWPDEVLAFRGMADMPPFEAGRDSIKPPVADPLA